MHLLVIHKQRTKCTVRKLKSTRNIQAIRFSGMLANFDISAKIYASEQENHKCACRWQTFFVWIFCVLCIGYIYIRTKWPWKWCQGNWWNQTNQFPLPFLPYNVDDWQCSEVNFISYSREVWWKLRTSLHQLWSFDNCVCRNRLDFTPPPAPMPPHVPYGLRGLPSRLWPKCNRLMS
jgi:hypothetical protein